MSLKHAARLILKPLFAILLTIAFISSVVNAEELTTKAENAFYAGDLKAAKNYYSELAKAENPNAHYYLGLIEKMSSSEKRNSVSMLAHFQKAASLGHALAMWEIGVAYEAGDGVQMDQFVAMDWFRKSEQHFVLPDDSVFFVTKPDGAQSEYAPTEYLEYLLTKAQAGDTSAQFSVATFYDKGQFTEVNRKTALKWYLAAAQNGHIKAATFASYFYCRGIVGDRDSVKAQYWAEKSNLTTSCED